MFKSYLMNNNDGKIFEVSGHNPLNDCQDDFLTEGLEK